METPVHAPRTEIKKSLLQEALDRRSKETALWRGSFLLLDTSGSMSDTVGVNQRKIDALRTTVEGIRGNGVKFRQITFGGYATANETDEISEPSGGTPLAEAIVLATQLGARHLCIISDGIPDDTLAANIAAKEFPGKIDVFFVGADNEVRGKDFLRSLALTSNGHFQHTELGSEQKELTEGATKSLLALSAGPSVAIAL